MTVYEMAQTDEECVLMVNALSSQFLRLIEKLVEQSVQSRFAALGAAKPSVSGTVTLKDFLPEKVDPQQESQWVYSVHSKPKQLGKAPAPSKHKSTPAQVHARKLQGQYMGGLRHLTPANRTKVQTECRKNGIDSALKMITKLNGSKK